MSKKYIIIVLVLILVLVGGGYYWKTRMQKPTTGAVSPVNPVSPTENVKGANPYDKTNPFSNVKVNPFE